MAHELPRHSVAVVGVIIGSDGRVLATRRRDNGIWEPPGGVLELGEAVTEGLCREVKEETGLLVEPEVLTGVYKNLSRGIVVLVFRCRPVGGRAGPTDEVSEILWLRPDEVDGYMTDIYAVRTHDALRPDGPFVRVHDGGRILDG
ncbi:MAG: NUDIX domain-containing protein [Streptosporangiales bacterium]|nr:NUDIX domain-containing protein [Streptosporangiales bacterium]